jgi:hypothetical protein
MKELDNYNSSPDINKKITSWKIIGDEHVARMGRCHMRKKKFWGELTSYLPLIRHVPHIKLRV